MAETLTIQITAQDGASKVFKAVSSGAQEVGKSAEEAGKRGKAGMDQLGQSAEQSASRMERLRAEATLIGAVMGTLASGIIVAGKAADTQARQMAALERMYGDSADAVIEYTEAIQDVTKFSDEAARQSAMVFNTLSENYSLSLDQIETLLMRSADLAELHGKTMEETSQMIQNALRGEAEYIEAIGVTLNDTFLAMQYAAQGLGDWNKLTDEAARAQFRYQELIRQTAEAQGFAGERAATAGGQFRQFINTMQDGVAAVGGFLGPIGQIGAELAPIAMALPVVSAGVGRLASAARGSSLAMGALSLAMNPVTLGVGALIAGGALLYKEFTEVGEATRDLDNALQGLEGTLESIRLSGDTATSARVETLLAEVQAIEDLINASNLPALNELLGTSFENALDFDTAPVRDDLQRVVDLTDDMVNQVTQNLQGLTAEQQRIYLDFVNDLLNSAETSMDDSNLDEIIEQILLTPASEVPGVMEAAAAATDDLAAANENLGGSYLFITRQIERAIEMQYQQGEMQKLARDNSESTRVAIDELTEAHRAQIDALRAVTGNDSPLAMYAEQMRAVVDVTQELDAVSGIQRIGQGALAAFDGIEQASVHAAILADNLTDAAAGLDTVFRAVVGNTNAIASQVDSVEKWATDLINVRGEYGKIDDLLAANVITIEEYTAAQEAQERISASNLAIQEDVLTIQAMQAPLIAEQTAALERQIDALADQPAEVQKLSLAWMDSATAARAVEIQTLAIAAASGELGANGQEMFASMVAGAAAVDPMLASILEDMDLIAIDREGNITVNGLEETVSDTQLLATTIGDLIDILDDGALNETYTVRVKAELDWGGGWGNAQDMRGGFFDQIEANQNNYAVRIEAEDAATPVINDVQSSMQALEDLSPVDVSVADVGGTHGIAAANYDSLLQKAQTLNDLVPDVGVQDAGGTHAIAAANLDALIDRAGTLDGIDPNISVTVSGADTAIGQLNAVMNAAFSASAARMLVPARHGGIPAYAMGGVLFEGGEAGPELAHFAGGGVAMLPSHGIYAAPPGTYISPANANPVQSAPAHPAPVVVHVHGNVYGVDDLADAIAGAVHQRRAGFGGVA